MAKRKPFSHLTKRADLFSKSWYIDSARYQCWKTAQVDGIIFFAVMYGHPAPWPWRDSWRDIAEYVGGP